MAGYFGTDTQQRLQALAERSVDAIRTTPGLCQVGRSIGCDDIDRLGTAEIDRIIDRDGVCGFRLLSASKADHLRAHLEARGCRFDTWNVFVAEREHAMGACMAIVDAGLTDGYGELKAPALPEGEYTGQMQNLMGSAGIVPFSGSFLTGELGDAITVVLGDGSGTVVAAAHGYMPHNSFSPYRGYAWGGLVAVADAHRGKRIGNYVNALMILSVFRNLGATHIYELVSSSNTPSRRMVEACGLRQAPALVSGIATPTDSVRFTP
jgi:hypothetical protein